MMLSNPGIIALAGGLAYWGSAAGELSSYIDSRERPVNQKTHNKSTHVITHAYKLFLGLSTSETLTVFSSRAALHDIAKL